MSLVTQIDIEWSICLCLIIYSPLQSHGMCVLLRLNNFDFNFSVKYQYVLELMTQILFWTDRPKSIQCDLMKIEEKN